jgi:hypothetical protein
MDFMEEMDWMARREGGMRLALPGRELDWMEGEGEVPFVLSPRKAVNRYRMEVFEHA